MSKRNYSVDGETNRDGDGKFTPKQRVASFIQQCERDQEIIAIAASTEHKSWLESNGYDDVDADMIFCSVRR